jgi:single-strand DNA-binding protein
MSLNTVTLVGRVGGEPDVKYFESGAVKCSLTLAVKRLSRNSDEPDWFNLEIWGKPAETAANWVHKGTQIGVTGSLKFDTWQDRTSGANRSKPIIRVDRLELLGSRKDNEAGGDMGYSNGGEEF